MGRRQFLDLTRYTVLDETKRDHLTHASHDGSWRSFQLCHFDVTADMIRPGDDSAIPVSAGEALAAMPSSGETIVPPGRCREGEPPCFLYRPRNRVEAFSGWMKDRNHVLQLSSRFLRERQYHFDPHVLDAPDNCYLMGYWESEKYFSDIRETLVKEFSLRNPLTGRNLEYKKQIIATESVGVHVRRGDALRPLALKKWKLLDPGYFRRCADIVAHRVSNPHFFVFSNDIEWAKSNLDLPFPVTFIEGNNEDAAFLELDLMRRCRHNIIANSSFSWWGAWLNCSKEKIVCAPARWFGDFDVDTKDLVPESWILVPNA